MKQESIEALLREKIGLDPQSIGSKNIIRAAIARQFACQLPDLKAYQQHLQTSSQELGLLIEAIVVPETWFFRDRKPFDFLKKFVASSEFSPTNQQPLSILSIPCSTGEEPYSIAIALLEAGLAPDRFRIDAVDISCSAIARAKRGLYQKHSFRGNALRGKERYFQITKEGYEIVPQVRKTVRFQQGNILDALKTTRNRYKIIFCRNLLIYLDSAARTRAIGILERLLISPGLLVVGAVETTIPKTESFSIIPQSFALTYRKRSKREEKRNEDRQDRDKMLPSFIPPVTRDRPGVNLGRDRESQPQQILTALSPTPDLATARELANRGQLDRAAELCAAYLQRDRASAKAYLLLGEVHQARGDDRQAEQCFRKVLYLNPNSYEALTYLLLLQEHRGDRDSATLLRQRLQRLRKA